MKRRLEDALQDCLEALAAGRATVDECLARYPDLAADLAPALRMGQRLQDVYDVEPSPLYAEAARQRFLAALASRRQRALTRALADQPRRAPWRWAPAALGSAALVTFAVWASVLALAGGTGGGTVVSPDGGGLAFSVPVPAAEEPEAPQPMVSTAVAEAQQHVDKIREAVEEGAPVDPVALQELRQANEILVEGLGAPEVSEEDLSRVEDLLADQQDLLADLGDSVPPEATDDLEGLITIAAEGVTKLEELRSPTPAVTPEASPTPEGTPAAEPEATGTPAPSPTPEATPAETPQSSPTPEAEDEATPTPIAAP